MKAFISLVLVIFSFTENQEISDMQTVMQLSIDLKELQPYFHNSTRPLVIELNKHVDYDVELTKFGLPVELKSKAEIFVENKKSFISFRQLSMNNAKAQVSFIYSGRGVLVDLELMKIGNDWIIDHSNLTEK